MTYAPLLLLALAAPVPFPKPPPRPLTERQVQAWLAAGPLVMTWRGADYRAAFSPPSDYLATPEWIGDYSVYAEGGAVRVWVREWPGRDRAGTPLEWTFPATLRPDGRMGGPMPGGGECWLRREKAPRSEDK